MRWLPYALPFLIFIGGFTVLYWGTDGWTVWTAEGARRNEIINDPVTLPDLVVETHRGTTATLSEFERKVLVIDFMFTRCASVCPAMGYEFQRLQQRIATLALSDDVQFLSISFDHDYDFGMQLSRYLRRFGASDEHWSALRITHRSELTALMNDLGVIVIPDETHGFVHNAATYLVADGKVVAITDYDDPRLTTAILELIRASET